MFMFKKSIVIKQFLLYMATISFCVILMGGMLSVIYTNHYMSETKQELIEQGWLVLRFWDFEIKKDVAACADKIEKAYKNRK